MARREIQPAVYLMVNWRNGTFYVGHTADLPQRIEQHRKAADLPSHANMAYGGWSGMSSMTRLTTPSVASG